MNMDVTTTVGDPETEAFEDKSPLPTRDKRWQ